MSQPQRGRTLREQTARTELTAEHEVWKMRLPSTNTPSQPDALAAASSATAS